MRILVLLVLRPILYTIVQYIKQPLFLRLNQYSQFAIGEKKKTHKNTINLFKYTQKRREKKYLRYIKFSSPHPNDVQSFLWQLDD